jgi:hypothetical protein
MRILIVCAIIAATIGVAGCFHHEEQVAQPLKLGEMSAK